MNAKISKEKDLFRIQTMMLFSGRLRQANFMLIPAQPAANIYVSPFISAI